LLYDYNARTLASPGEASVDHLLPYATTLVAELCAQRSDPRSRKRPIIFICHGVGGLLVKRALAFSQTRQAPRVEHLRSIYLSTYAILFMGTPHKGIKQESLLLWEENKLHGPSGFIVNLLEGSEMINTIADLFASTMDDFCIFNFWEEIKTPFVGDRAAYIVDPSSAAPQSKNVEESGVRATHSGMVKFGHAENYGYQLVQEALGRYTKSSSEHIRLRWDETVSPIDFPNAGSAYEQHQPSLNDVPTNDTFATDFNKWFLVERKPTTFFTGREAHARNVKRKFSEAQRQVGRKSHAIFVVYGLGGSGKTHFCLKYAHDNRSRYIN
jgi:hypothetical protein